MRRTRAFRTAGGIVAVLVLLSGCSRPDPVQQAFADAIAAGDLAAAWAVLEPPVGSEKEGRGYALTYEHFLAAFDGVALTGERDVAFGHPLYRWPDGTVSRLSLYGGPQGSAHLGGDVLSVTVNGTDAPVRVWLDGVEVPGARFEEGTVRGWLHLSLWMFPGGARTVEVEFVSGKRLEVAVPAGWTFVLLNADVGSVEVYEDGIPAPSDRRPTFVTPQGP
jgi:hypothetical protein